MVTELRGPISTRRGCRGIHYTVPMPYKRFQVKSIRYPPDSPPKSRRKVGIEISSSRTPMKVVTTPA